MTGLTKKFNLNKNYWETPKPILPSELPNVKLDHLGLTRYALSVGKKISELSKEEKNQFIQPR